MSMSHLGEESNVDKCNTEKEPVSKCVSMKTTIRKADILKYHEFLNWLQNTCKWDTNMPLQQKS